MREQQGVVLISPVDVSSRGLQSHGGLRKVHHDKGLVKNTSAYMTIFRKKRYVYETTAIRAQFPIHPPSSNNPAPHTPTFPPTHLPAEFGNSASVSLSFAAAATKKTPFVDIAAPQTTVNTSIR